MYFDRFVIALAVATVAKSEVHVVDVGENGLKFEPQTLNPKKGDTVIFHLYPRHNVVSTTFNAPCVSNDDSWFSGPFDQTDNGKKRFVVNVTTEDPVYYYCAVQRHCQQGMVGAWNVPSEGDTMEAFADAAQKASQASAPASIKGGQLLEDSQISSITSGGASPTESGSSSGSTSEATSTASGSGSSSPSASGATVSGTPGAAVTAAPGTGGLALAVGLAAFLV